MSAVVRRRVLLRCDVCGATLEEPDTDSTITARINGGMKGWRFLAARGGQGARGQRYWDFCPTCEPKIPDA